MWYLLLGTLVASAHTAFVVGTALGAVWLRALHLRWMALGFLGMRKVNAGATAAARRLGEELLRVATDDPDYWDYGNAVFKAHTVLGRVALREGDVARAKHHLLQAGRSPGSPQLDSFGPNMTLAKELLEAGERDSVLEFFTLCGKFWVMGSGKLLRWRIDVKYGRIPEFGVQLLY